MHPRVRFHSIQAGAITFLCCILGASTASAGDIEIQFTATVLNAFGDFGTVLSGGETITGTLVLDDSVAGVYTPSGNPQFVRHEMLYAGAVTSTSLVIDGHAVSGTGGDVVLLDADVGSLAGADTYEPDAVIDTGTVAGVAVSSMLWNAEYPADGFTLAPGDPLFPPPPMVASFFYQITIASPGGGSLYCFIDDFQVVGGPAPVPAMGVLSQLGLIGVLAVATVAALSRRQRTLG
jgi:hypothetical protein